MAMQRWRPWLSPFRELERDMEEMFERLPRRLRRGFEEGAWLPPLEMIEKDDHFLIRAELPGMKKEDIEITFVAGALVIRGERRLEKETKEENYYLAERSYGTFHRTISIPSTVDAKNVQAKYENGILEITAPKAPEAKPQKIQIEAK